MSKRSLYSRLAETLSARLSALQSSPVAQKSSSSRSKFSPQTNGSSSASSSGDLTATENPSEKSSSSRARTASLLPPESLHDLDVPLGTGLPLGVSALSGWEALVERQIQAAQRRGTFENLPGKGKPLPPPSFAPPGVDELEWQVNKVLAGQGYKPEWVEMLGNIHKSIQEAAEKLLEPHWSDKERQDIIAAVNRKILHFNVTAPDKVKRMPLFEPEPNKRYTTILNASQIYGRTSSPAQPTSSGLLATLSPSIARASSGNSSSSSSVPTSSATLGLTSVPDESPPLSLREQDMEHAEETRFPGSSSRQSPPVPGVASTFDPDDPEVPHPIASRFMSSGNVDERTGSPPPFRTGDAAAATTPPSNPPESLTLADLQRMVKMAAKSKSPLYDFTYADMDELQHEVDEFYNYQDGPHVQDGRMLFERWGLRWEYASLLKVSNPHGFVLIRGPNPPEWTETPEADQLTFISCILEDLESRDVDRRCAAAKILQYISQGTFAETTTVPAHISLIIQNSRLLRRANALPYVYAALRLVSSTLDRLVHESQPSPADTTGNSGADYAGPHQGALDSANVEVGIYLSVMYMIVVGCTGEEAFGRELVETDPPVVSFLFGLVARLAEGNRKHYPVKKTVLATLGGTSRMRGIKEEARRRAGLPHVVPESLYAKADPQEYSQFVTDTTARYPSVYLPSLTELTNLNLPWDHFPRPPQVHQQTPQPVLLAIPASHAGIPGVPPSIRNAVDSYRRNIYVRLADVQIAREKERMDVELLKDSAGGANGAVAVASFRRREDEVDELEGAELPVSRKNSRKSQKTQGLEELLEEDSEETISDQPETDAEFLEREDIVYQVNLSGGTGGGAPREGVEDGSDSTAASSEQTGLLPGQDRKEYVDRMDVQRHKEVVTKAVSAILVLLLKHGKLSHALHFEHICQLLHDNNCAILILKMLSTWFQNPSAGGAGADGGKSPAPGSAAANMGPAGGAGMAAAWLSARENVDELNFFWFCRHSPDEDSTSSTTQSVITGGDERSPVALNGDSKSGTQISHLSAPTQVSSQQSGFIVGTAGPSLIIPALAAQSVQRYQPSCWRNFFTSINLLRVLQKLTKRKLNRVVSLVQWKASAVLKRVLKVNHLAVQLYALKLLKSQLPYLGRKWRTSNMRIITAIYLHIRPDLKDDNLCCDVEVDNDEAQVRFALTVVCSDLQLLIAQQNQEQQLRLIVSQFHAQKYSVTLQESGSFSSDRPPEEYPLDLDGHQGTYTEALSLDDNFTENYEHWLSEVRLFLVVLVTSLKFIRRWFQEVYDRSSRSELRNMFISQTEDEEETGKIEPRRLMIDELDGMY
ncbi:Factor arrest protein 11 [Gonapodya sp. JEL0774]|nr:Factor arrest protein 11 [Gonapodya sp. JEL0774]